jgi:prevent-host-death family protein
MVRQVNLYEAKTNLSRLVEDAAKGEEIVIAKNGRPMAKLVVVGPTNEDKPKKRALGQWAHLVDPNDKRTDEEWWRDWKAMDAEIEHDFEESLNRDFPKGAEEGREFKWDATSSTLTSSSGRKKDRRGSGRTRLPKSKKRKTRSS